jgi:hypothetical protein
MISSADEIEAKAALLRAINAEREHRREARIAAQGVIHFAVHFIVAPGEQVSDTPSRKQNPGR